MPAGAGQPVCLLTSDDKPKVLKADKGLNSRTTAQKSGRLYVEVITCFEMTVQQLKIIEPLGMKTEKGNGRGHGTI